MLLPHQKMLQRNKRVTVNEVDRVLIQFQLYFEPVIQRCLDSLESNICTVRAYLAQVPKATFRSSF